MTREEMLALERGDIVRNTGGSSYVVERTGEGIIAVSTVSITNPEEWTRVTRPENTKRYTRILKYVACQMQDDLQRWYHSWYYTIVLDVLMLKLDPYTAPLMAPIFLAGKFRDLVATRKSHEEFQDDIHRVYEALHEGRRFQDPKDAFRWFVWNATPEAQILCCLVAIGEVI